MEDFPEDFSQITGRHFRKLFKDWTASRDLGVLLSREVRKRETKISEFNLAGLLNSHKNDLRTKELLEKDIELIESSNLASKDHILSSKYVDLQLIISNIEKLEKEIEKARIQVDQLNDQIGLMEKDYFAMQKSEGSLYKKVLDYFLWHIRKLHANKIFQICVLVFHTFSTSYETMYLDEFFDKYLSSKVLTILIDKLNDREYRITFYYYSTSKKFQLSYIISAEDTDNSLPKSSAGAGCSASF